MQSVKGFLKRITSEEVKKMAIAFLRGFTRKNPSFTWNEEKEREFLDLSKRMSLFEAYKEVDRELYGLTAIAFAYSKVTNEKMLPLFLDEIPENLEEVARVGPYKVYRDPKGNFYLDDPKAIFAISKTLEKENILNDPERHIYLLLPFSKKEFLAFYRGEIKNSSIKARKDIKADEEITFWFELLSKGILEGWGDVYLNATANYYEIVYRNRLGKLEKLTEIPKEQAESEMRKLLLWTGQKEAEKIDLPVAIDASLNFSFETKSEAEKGKVKLFKALRELGAEADFRISVIPTKFGKSLDIRILPKNRRIGTLKDLGYGEERMKIEALTYLKQGLILISGPTGSGKSTLLYAVIKSMNPYARRIITIENPVEVVLHGVQQIEVKLPVRDEKGNIIGIDFALALRSCLRQNPDVIVVGETRDTETARKAIEASNTGHLVLTTVHANDELSTIRRMLELAVGDSGKTGEYEFVLTQIKAVIAQRLVPRLCENCKNQGLIPQVEVDEKLLMSVPAIAQEKLEQIRGQLIYRNPDPNRTCGECHKGFTGRIPIIGILEMNTEITDYLIEKKMNITRKEFESVAKDRFSALTANALEKLKNGEITLESFLEIV